MVPASRVSSKGEEASLTAASVWSVCVYLGPAPSQQTNTQSVLGTSMLLSLGYTKKCVCSSLWGLDGLKALVYCSSRSWSCCVACSAPGWWFTEQLKRKVAAHKYSCSEKAQNNLIDSFWRGAFASGFTFILFNKHFGCRIYQPRPTFPLQSISG